MITLLVLTSVVLVTAAIVLTIIATAIQMALEDNSIDPDTLPEDD